MIESRAKINRPGGLASSSGRSHIEDVNSKTATHSPNIIFVNSTGVDVRAWDNGIMHSVRTGEPLPADIADLMTLEIRHDLNADGSPRGILRMA